jgi:hypothetical protein
MQTAGMPKYHVSRPGFFVSESPTIEILGVARQDLSGNEVAGGSSGLRAEKAQQVCGNDFEYEPRSRIF